MMDNNNAVKEQIENFYVGKGKRIQDALYVVKIYVEYYNTEGFKKPDVIIRLFRNEMEAILYKDSAIKVEPKYYPEAKAFVKPTGDWTIDYMVIG